MWQISLQNHPETALGSPWAALWRLWDALVTPMAIPWSLLGPLGEPSGAKWARPGPNQGANVSPICAKMWPKTSQNQKRRLGVCWGVFLEHIFVKNVNFGVLVGLWDVLFAHRGEPLILHTLLCF